MSKWARMNRFSGRDADAPISRDAEPEIPQFWEPASLDIRPLDASERNSFTSRWLTDVRGQLLVDAAVAIENADSLVAEMMHARGFPVDPLDWHMGTLSAEQAELVREFHAGHDLAHDARRAIQHYRHLFDELVA